MSQINGGKIMQDEYLTIKEFATRVGVSTQAIYKRVPTDLQPYIKWVGSKKYINIKALSLFEYSQGLQTNAANTTLNNHVTEFATGEVIYLREQNKRLQEELSREREYSRGQAEELNREREHSRGLAERHAERLADLATQLAELSRNNQVLLGMEKENQGMEKDKPLGFWRRIFGKK
jgi:hypothetical protein